MAEKSFGVKEVNLIGASGTPTITSPNNLNLNAINVAISTNVSIGGTLSVSGNVSVGGTLTYEDVTNVDVVGVSTFNDTVNIVQNKNLKFAGNNGGIIYADGSNFLVEGTNQSGQTYIRGGGSLILSGGQVGSHQNTIVVDKSGGNGYCQLMYGGNTKLQTTSSGIEVTGSVSVNGSPIGSAPSNSDIQVVYTVTANGSSAYRFSGNGVEGSADDPELYLIRGIKYRFINNSGGNHPFKIRTYADAATNSDVYNYNTGVTGNGNTTGNIDFDVPYNSPAVLYYQCSNHPGMFGKIYIRGASGQNDKVGFTTFSEGIDIDHPSAAQKWTIVNNSANTLRFMRGTTTDFSFGPNGQLGLGGWAAGAYGEEGQVAVSNSSSGGSPEWGSALYYPTSYNNYDPTGVNGFINNTFPSWISKVTVLWHELSLNGTNQVLFQFRNASGDITSGYNSCSRSSTGSTSYNSTSGFVIGSNSASHVYSGKMEIQRVASLKWVETHTLLKTTTSGASNELRHGGGHLTISNTIPTGWVISASGSNNFDGNTRVTVFYQ